MWVGRGDRHFRTGLTQVNETARQSMMGITPALDAQTETALPVSRVALRPPEEGLGLPPGLTVVRDRITVAGGHGAGLLEHPRRGRPVPRGHQNKVVREA